MFGRALNKRQSFVSNTTLKTFVTQLEFNQDCKTGLSLGNQNAIPCT